KLGQMAQLGGELAALIDRAFEPLLPHRNVEAGLSQRIRERAEGVPVERLRGHRAAMVVEVPCARGVAELLPQLAQQAEQLLPRRDPARDESGGSLCGVPAAEVLDHRLRVNGGLRVTRELAHRRSGPEPAGAFRAAP